ncbi:MAG: SufD family Fe-S cluster assembly protein [Spirochaetales bacterium]|nr:SufD family Fe-S cluster assembly protein [Spirochaetales bacterium]
MSRAAAEAQSLIREAGIDRALQDPDTAHLVLNVNQVLQSRLVAGLSIETSAEGEAVRARIRVQAGAVIEKPVHLCFGVTEQEALQRILLDIQVGPEARIAVLAHCIFPDATKVRHEMDAEISIGERAQYSYLESHVHSERGGLEVIPRARVRLAAGARFKTEFQLLRGRVGSIDMDYETLCGPESVLEMLAKISGREEDRIRIREVGMLEGRGARGYLTSRVAARDRATAEVFNKLVASAPYARGHVDCKEIIKDQGVASAIPVVEVRHPQAHVTHEAAIGSVDSKQLETLMSRGLDEDQASDLIIAGLLR